jgi:hypothetical protein
MRRKDHHECSEVLANLRWTFGHNGATRRNRTIRRVKYEGNECSSINDGRTGGYSCSAEKATIIRQLDRLNRRCLATRQTALNCSRRRRRIHRGSGVRQVKCAIIEPAAIYTSSATRIMNLRRIMDSSNYPPRIKLRSNLVGSFPDSRDFCGPNCGFIGHSEIAATRRKKHAVAAR